MKYILTLVFSLFCLGISSVYGQIPTGVPGPEDNSKIDLTSLADILIYIVMPIIIILLLLFRVRKNKNK